MTYLAEHLGRRAKSPLDQQNSATAMRSVPPATAWWCWPHPAT